MRYPLLFATAEMAILHEQLSPAKGDSNDTQAWYLSRGSGSPPVKVF
jgi:hypothetical protein